MPASTREELFVVDPVEFVAARDALARELRAGGDKEGAAAVRALRRPAVPVWALNRVASSDAGAVDELLDAEDAARDAQEAVFAGADRRELREALARRRAALQAVVRAAGEVVAASGRPAASQQREVESTLNAVLASDELRGQLRRAQLVGIDKDESDDTDDDLTAMLTGSLASAGPTTEKAKKAPAGKGVARKGAGAKATQADELAAKRLASARADVARLDAEVGEATARADEARQAVHTADADLESARDALARAEEAARTARKAAAEAERAEAKATTALEQAKAKLETLDAAR